MPGYYYYYFVLQYGPLIPLLVAVPNFKKLDRPLRIFAWYMMLSLLLTILMTVLALRKMNNLWVMNLSQPIYVVMILWVFQLWESETKLRTLMKGCIVLFVSVWLYEIILQNKVMQFSTYTIPLEGIIFIFVSCLTIYQANRDLDEPIVDKPRFWISAGMLLYFGGVIIIDLVSERLLEKSDETLRLVLLLQVTLNLCAQIFYLIAYRCRIRKFWIETEGALA